MKDVVLLDLLAAEHARLVAAEALVEQLRADLELALEQATAAGDEPQGGEGVAPGAGTVQD